MSPKRRWISGPTRSGWPTTAKVCSTVSSISPGHRGPLAAHRQLVQVGVQAGPAVQVQHGAVGGGGAVEGELFADGSHRGLKVAVGVAGGDQPRVADAEPVA